MRIGIAKLAMGVNLEGAMNVTIQIPDELARDLAASGGDLSRRALEAFALEEYKNGHRTRPAMRKLLGSRPATSWKDFLRRTPWFEDLQTLDDFERESQDMRSPGF